MLASLLVVETEPYGEGDDAVEANGIANNNSKFWLLKGDDGVSVANQTQIVFEKGRFHQCQHLKILHKSIEENFYNYSIPLGHRTCIHVHRHLGTERGQMELASLLIG